MQIEDEVIDALKALPSGEKLKVLEFTKSLRPEKPSGEQNGQRRSVKGALSHLNIRFTENDLREARNEMWKGYTRDTE